MTRIAILIAGLSGLAVIARAIAFYAGVDAIALTVCIGMGVVLLLGTIELVRVATLTDALRSELSALPADADVTVLERVSPELRSLLHARLERVALPVPTAMFTPYFVGLLVMLGLLGTFLGLFETLRGTHLVLGSSGDVDALRQGLIQPMQGLMRSFGTSAAGVTGSAMLGLASVFGRRSAAELTRSVHVLVAGALSSASPAERQLAAITQLAEQGRSLPDAAKALATATAQLETLRADLVRSLEATGRAGADALTTAARAQTEALASAAKTQTEALASAAKTQTEVMTTATKAQTDALAASSRSQSDALVAAAKSQTEAMARSVEQLATSLANTAKQAHEGQSTAATATQNALREMAERIERSLGTTIEKVDAAQAKSMAHAATLREEADARADARQREALEASVSRIDTAIVTTLAKAGESAVLAGERAVEATRQAITTFSRDAAETQVALLATLAEKQLAASEASLSTHAEALIRGLNETAAVQADADRARTEALLEAVRTRFEAANAHERDRTEALTGALTGIATTVATETNAAVSAQVAVAERLRTLVEESARSLGALEEAASSRESASAARLTELVTKLERELAAASETFVTAMSETTSSTRETEARAAASFEHLAATADQVAASARAQAEAIAALATHSSTGLEEAEQRAEARLEALTTTLGGKLTETSDVVREAAVSVQAASIELGATAEAFVGAVERNQRAAEEWLANLGRVEAAVAEAGEEAASDTLAQHLAHMHDVFERQIRFQQEVFEQLRALRGARGVEPVTETIDGPS
jgi:hypothetical protein